MKPLIWLFALFSLLTVTREADVIASHDTVNVVDGEDAILPCQLKETFSSTISVLWKRNGTIVHLYRSKADDLVKQDKNFVGRTSLFPDELAKGNFSLTLTNVTELDAGNYTCEGRVNDLSGKGLVRQCNVNLIVEPKRSKGNPTNILGHRDNQNTDIGAKIGIVIGIVIGIGIRQSQRQGQHQSRHQHHYQHQHQSRHKSQHQSQNQSQSQSQSQNMIPVRVQDGEDTPGKKARKRTILRR
ncbi:uncharacterized protein LOC119481540 [Sebastes umbrosus]|uniref:uncharacterized protein LOC119481540 n=1 Tax=Sebastes umbrosus TaxID=72105 RepID=UPI00189CEA0A|nr:uncharacterized protein LOC119481540 [Sebastes umbrosus]